MASSRALVSVVKLAKPHFGSIGVGLASSSMLAYMLYTVLCKSASSRLRTRVMDEVGELGRLREGVEVQVARVYPGSSGGSVVAFLDRNFEGTGTSVCVGGLSVPDIQGPDFVQKLLDLGVVVLSSSLQQELRTGVMAKVGELGRLREGVEVQVARVYPGSSGGSVVAFLDRNFEGTGTSVCVGGLSVSDIQGPDFVQKLLDLGVLVSAG